MNRKMTLLALAGQRRGLGRQRVDKRRRPVGRDGLPGQEAVAAEQARQRDRPEAAADLPEELAPGAAAERGRATLSSMLIQSGGFMGVAP